MRAFFMIVFVNTIRMLANILIASVHFLILSADAIRKLTNGRSVLLSSNAAFFAKTRRFLQEVEQILVFLGAKGGFSFADFPLSSTDTDFSLFF